MKDCVFCKVLKEKPEKIILKNDLCFAIYDEFPVSKGHVLIIPKRHVPPLFMLREEEILALSKLVKEAKKLLDTKYYPDRYNIDVNEGRAGGRTVDHVHIHLIPRYKGDVDDPTGGVRNVIPGKGNYLKHLKLH